MGLRIARHRSVAARPRRRGAGARVLVEGTARIDRRTKDLVWRLKPGNIAVIDHDDLDRVAAESLVEHGVAAVVNARASISGRYPNLGPLILLNAGIPVLDDVGPLVFEHVTEGEVVCLEGETLLVGGREVAKGRLLTEAMVHARMDEARAVLSRTVEQFAENTLEYVRNEQDILLEGARLEGIRTHFKGRHALVVTRGHHYKEDLRALRGYIREMRPVVVAVDGAADALIAEGFKPDAIVGDMDSISSSALHCGAELFVHPQGDWRRRHLAGEEPPEPPGVTALKAMGLECTILTGPGTSEDVAMLLAHEQGADLVVAVGSHSSMPEFLDKGRKGMASTFLVRMRLGPSLVDAKGVSQLYRTRVTGRDLALLILAALVTMAIVSAVSPSARVFWSSLWEVLTQALFRLRASL